MAARGDVIDQFLPSLEGSKDVVLRRGPDVPRGCLQVKFYPFVRREVSTYELACFLNASFGYGGTPFTSVRDCWGVIHPPPLRMVSVGKLPFQEVSHLLCRVHEPHAQSWLAHVLADKYTEVYATMRAFAEGEGIYLPDQEIVPSIPGVAKDVDYQVSPEPDPPHRTTPAGGEIVPFTPLRRTWRRRAWRWLVHRERAKRRRDGQMMSSFLK